MVRRCPHQLPNPPIILLHLLFFSQIIPPHNINIQNCITDNLPPAAGPDSFREDFLDDFSERTVPSLVDGLDRHSKVSESMPRLDLHSTRSVSKEYYDDLHSFVYDETMNRGSGVKIVYSAMHGVGANFVDKAFEVAGFNAVVHVKKQRGY